MKAVHFPFVRRGQQGSSLIFALMALVVLSLAAVGLVRSVNTGALIAGNLSFKRDATLSAASAAEQAMQWLQGKVAAGATALDNDDAAAGYFASARDNLDVTGNSTSASRPMAVVNWDGNCQGLPSSNYTACNVVPFTGTSVNGNRVQWIITRLCDFAGPYPANPNGTNLCARPPATAAGQSSDKGALSTSARLTPAQTTPYYRIVTRVEGPRNTVSYVETIVHF